MDISSGIYSGRNDIVLPPELIAAVIKEWGGYGAIFILAGYILYKYLTDASTKKQKRLDDQQTLVDDNWERIRREKDNQISKLEQEINQIREGHRERLKEAAALIVAKDTEIVLLKKQLSDLAEDNENGWSRGRGAMRLVRAMYHGRNNDRQISDAIMRRNQLEAIAWPIIEEPPDLADVTPVKG
jgi:hypothetical protein